MAEAAMDHEEEQTLESVADRLRRNEAGYSCLNLNMNPGYEARDVNLLRDAVVANHTLETVKFFGILADDDVNEAVQSLVEAFGNLPNLKSLTFAGYCEDVVQALIHTLNQAGNLEYLCLIHVQLNGTRQELSGLNEAIARHPKLNSISILQCQVSSDMWEREDFMEDLIFHGFSQLGTLEDVILQPFEPSSLGILSSKALSKLCRLPNLRTLGVYGFEQLSMEQYRYTDLMAEDLSSSPHLKRVEIPSSFSETNCESLVNLIRRSKTLIRIRLELFLLANQSNTDFLQKIGAALLENTSVKFLDVHVMEGPCFEAQALEEFAACFESHFDMFSVDIHWNGEPLQRSPMLSFYLKLNRLGRRDLVRYNDQARSKWVDKLVEVRNDEASLFYFLSINPSLCSPSND